MRPRLFEVWFAAGAVVAEEEGVDVVVDAVLALDGPFASVALVTVHLLFAANQTGNLRPPIRNCT